MRLFLALVALSMTLAAFSSCGSDDDEQDTDEAGEGEGEGEGEEGLLTDSHAGWRKPACDSCHEADGHNEGLMPSECVECHGNNGALDKGAHADQESCSCHMEDIANSHAPADDFPAPDSCGVCH